MFDPEDPYSPDDFRGGDFAAMDELQASLERAFDDAIGGACEGPAPLMETCEKHGDPGRDGVERELGRTNDPSLTAETERAMADIGTVLGPTDTPSLVAEIDRAVGGGFEGVLE